MALLTSPLSVAPVDRSVGSIASLVNRKNSILFYIFLRVVILTSIAATVSIAIPFIASVISFPLLVPIAIPILVGGTFVISLFVLAVKNSKKTYFELSLLFSFCNKTRRNKWWSEIDLSKVEVNGEKITLGNGRLLLSAVPLNLQPLSKKDTKPVERSHLDRLQQDEKIGAVLCLLEPKEQIPGLVTPVTKDQWEKKGIIYMNVPTEDDRVISQKKLTEAINFLETHLKNNETVLIHCKAGVGRTIQVACALLAIMLWRNSDNTQSLQECSEIAHTIIKNARPQQTLTYKERQKVISRVFPL